MNGSEAFAAFVDSTCRYNLACSDVYASHEACVEELETLWGEAWSDPTDGMCFDGSWVDECLAEIEASAERCVPSMSACDEAFYPPSGDGKDCVQRGW